MIARVLKRNHMGQWRKIVNTPNRSIITNQSRCFTKSYKFDDVHDDESGYNLKKIIFVQKLKEQIEEEKRIVKEEDLEKQQYNRKAYDEEDARIDPFVKRLSMNYCGKCGSKLNTPVYKEEHSDDKDSKKKPNVKEDSVHYRETKSSFLKDFREGDSSKLDTSGALFYQTCSNVFCDYVHLNEPKILVTSLIEYETYESQLEFTRNLKAFMENEALIVQHKKNFITERFRKFVERSSSSSNETGKTLEKDVSEGSVLYGSSSNISHDDDSVREKVKKIVLVQNKGWDTECFGLVSSRLLYGQSPLDTIQKSITDSLGNDLKFKEHTLLETFYSTETNSLVLVYYNLIEGEQLKLNRDVLNNFTLVDPYHLQCIAETNIGSIVESWKKKNKERIENEYAQRKENAQSFISQTKKLMSDSLGKI